MPSWLWMGPVVAEEVMLAGAAQSPAANRWQLGLLRALSGLGISMEVLSYSPERAWPMGRAWMPGAAASPVPGLSVTTVGYLNVPGWRQRSLARAHRRLLRKRLASGTAPAAILTYNAPAGPASAALEVQEALGIPWIAVVSDVDGQAGAASVDAYLERVHRAAGRVVLPWSVYRDRCRAPKIHIDGGVTCVRPDPGTQEPGAFLYTGLLGGHAGIELLLKAFREISAPGVELWICGKHPTADFLRRVEEDRRVCYHGAVSERELEALSNRAAAFVNPRPVTIRESDFNFPSKILEYLSYGKPVVSTWTPGLAPEYRDILVVADGDSPGELARAMESVLGWSPGRRVAYRERVAAFLERDRLWAVQAARLRRWVEDSVLP